MRCRYKRSKRARAEIEVEGLKLADQEIEEEQDKAAIFAGMPSDSKARKPGEDAGSGFLDNLDV